MRKTMLLLAVFGLIGSLWAADPIIGTWKLNVDKSKGSPDATSKRTTLPTTVVYREVEGNLIEMSDGSPASDKWTWPSQGGVASRKPPLAENMLYVETLIEPGHWYVTIMRDGKQTGSYHKIVDKDGKTLRQTLKYLLPDGKLLEVLMIYDRQ